MNNTLITIENLREDICTIGAKKFIGRELRLTKFGQKPEDYIRLMEYLIEYISSASVTIQDGETISYYSWLLKFVSSNDLYFDIFELNEIGKEFEDGADLAIEIYNAQSAVCDEFNVQPNFINFSQKIAISEGVLDSLPIEAVRYSAPEHMTGWYLTTELYDDDIESLKIVHVFHVLFKRPEIVKYLSLPPGFRFFGKENNIDAWFDMTVIQEE